MQALEDVDDKVGWIPSKGAKASLKDIQPFLRYIEKCVDAEFKNIFQIVGQNESKIWWYDGRIISFRTPTRRQILEAIQQNSKVTVAELSSQLQINTSAIQKHLKAMQEAGYIARIGGLKNGHWHISAFYTTRNGGINQ